MSNMPEHTVTWQLSEEQARRWAEPSAHSQHSQEESKGQLFSADHVSLKLQGNRKTRREDRPVLSAYLTAQFQQVKKV